MCGSWEDQRRREVYCAKSIDYWEHLRSTSVAPQTMVTREGICLRMEGQSSGKNVNACDSQGACTGSGPQRLQDVSLGLGR